MGREGAKCGRKFSAGKTYGFGFRVRIARIAFGFFAMRRGERGNFLGFS